MKTVVIHGQKHKGSTYHITKMLLEKMNCDECDISEFYVNGINDCTGCFQCVMKGEQYCPDRTQTEEIIKAIEEADVIVIDSPTYVLNMSGQLKTFFDHMGYRWVTHRPYPTMKEKIGVAISTTAGAGALKTTKEIATQMRWWCVGKVYRIPVAVSAMNWNQVSSKKKKEIEKITTKTAKSVIRKAGHVRPGMKAKCLFFLMKLMHKDMDYSPVDKAYWKEQGWI